MSWDWIEVAVCCAFVVGVALGAMGCWLLMKRTVQMFKVLWENEKAGNFIMTERLSKLEEEREDLS